MGKKSMGCFPVEATFGAGVILGAHLHLESMYLEGPSLWHLLDCWHVGSSLAGQVLHNCYREESTFS